MSLPSTHVADLIDNGYKEPKRNPHDPDKYALVSIDGVDYEPLKYVDNEKTGYQGTIYQRMDTGEIVVVHRGTEFDREPIKDGAIADGQMVARKANPQLPDALELTRDAQELAVKWAKRHPGEPHHEVTVAGHSLGGALAQATAYYYGLRGETFNAYGAVGLTVGGKVVPADGGSQITNHVMATDPVSAGNAHFGQTKVYATRGEIAFLNGTGGYERGSMGPGNALTTAVGHGFGMHSIRHFSRVALDNGQPHPYSALQDPQAQVLATRHAVQIAQFRDELRGVREQVTVGAQVGGALGTGAGYAATAPTRVQAWTLDTTGDAVRAATHVQGKGMEYGGHMAGAALGGTVRGVGELAAQGRQLRGEASATVDQLQGVVEQHSAQSMADLLRGVASLLPEEQRRQVEQVAGQLARSGEQAQARQQGAAEASRRAAHDDAQQWRAQSQALGDRTETHLREGGRQVGEAVASSGRRVDEQLDRAGHRLKQSADQVTQAGRVAGEGVGAVGALLGGAAARQAIDAPTENAERTRDAIRAIPIGSQPAPETKREPLSYTAPARPQHSLFKELREKLPTGISDEKVAELTLAARQGGVRPNRVESVHVLDNGDAWVLGTIPGFDGMVNLRTPAPPMAETMQKAEAFEQQQQVQVAQWQEQRQSQSQGRAMA